MNQTKTERVMTKIRFWPFRDLDLDLLPDWVALPPKAFTERSVVYLPNFKQFCPAVWDSIRHKDQADTYTHTHTHTHRPTILYIYRLPLVSSRVSAMWVGLYVKKKNKLYVRKKILVLIERYVYYSLERQFVGHGVEPFNFWKMVSDRMRQLYLSLLTIKMFSSHLWFLIVWQGIFVSYQILTGDIGFWTRYWQGILVSELDIDGIFVSESDILVKMCTVYSIMISARREPDLIRLSLLIYFPFFFLDT